MSGGLRTGRCRRSEAGGSCLRAPAPTPPFGGAPLRRKPPRPCSPHPFPTSATTVEWTAEGHGPAVVRTSAAPQLPGTAGRHDRHAVCIVHGAHLLAIAPVLQGSVGRDTPASPTERPRRSLRGAGFQPMSERHIGTPPGVGRAGRVNVERITRNRAGAVALITAPGAAASTLPPPVGCTCQGDAACVHTSA